MSCPPGRKMRATSGIHLYGSHQIEAPYSLMARSKLPSGKGVCSALPRSTTSSPSTDAGSAPSCASGTEKIPQSGASAAQARGAHTPKLSAHLSHSSRLRRTCSGNSSATVCSLLSHSRSLHLSSMGRTSGRRPQVIPRRSRRLHQRADAGRVERIGDVAVALGGGADDDAVCPPEQVIHLVRR